MAKKRPGAKKIKRQIEATMIALTPDCSSISGRVELTKLIQMFFNYMEIEVDKVFAQFKKRVEHAERIIIQGNERMQRTVDRFEARYGHLSLDENKNFTGSLENAMEANKP